MLEWETETGTNGFFSQEVREGFLEEERFQQACERTRTTAGSQAQTFRFVRPRRNLVSIGPGTDQLGTNRKQRHSLVSSTFTLSLLLCLLSPLLGTGDKMTAAAIAPGPRPSSPETPLCALCTACRRHPRSCCGGPAGGLPPPQGQRQELSM